jgi:hypothetical protein
LVGGSMTFRVSFLLNTQYLGIGLKRNMWIPQDSTALLLA